MYKPREFVTPMDVHGLFALTSDPAVTRYLGFRTHTGLEQAAELIHAYKTGPGRWFAVDGPRGIAGVVGIERQGHAAALAIYFGRPSRGAGRIVSTAFVQWVFENPQIKRAFAHCHVDNVPVQHVLERMGATREGRMRNYAVFPNVGPEPADCYLYSLLPGELRGLK